MEKIEASNQKTKKSKCEKVRKRGAGRINKALHEDAVSDIGRIKVGLRKEGI